MYDMFPKMSEKKTFQFFLGFAQIHQVTIFVGVMFVAKTNIVIHVTYILRGCLNEFIHPITT